MRSRPSLTVAVLVQSRMPCCICHLPSGWACMAAHRHPSSSPSDNHICQTMGAGSVVTVPEFELCGRQSRKYKATTFRQPCAIGKVSSLFCHATPYLRRRTPGRFFFPSSSPSIRRYVYSTVPTDAILMLRMKNVISNAPSMTIFVWNLWMTRKQEPQTPR